MRTLETTNAGKRKACRRFLLLIHAIAATYVFYAPWISPFGRFTSKATIQGKFEGCAGSAPHDIQLGPKRKKSTMPSHRMCCWQGCEATYQGDQPANWRHLLIFSVATSGKLFCRHSGRNVGSGRRAVSTTRSRTGGRFEIGT